MLCKGTEGIIVDRPCEEGLIFHKEERWEKDGWWKMERHDNEGLLSLCFRQIPVVKRTEFDKIKK